MRFAALLVSALALAACQQDPPHQGARDASVPPLEVTGYGPMTIGMTLAEARVASHQPMNGEAIEDANTCVEQPFTTTDGDTLYLMFEDSRLARVTASAEATHTRTAQNVGVGSTDAEVRAAYQNVREEPAKYEAAPAHDLIIWTAPDRAGFRFEVDASGHVNAVHAGGPAILYVEGCA